MKTKHTPGPWQVASEATATVLGPSKTGLRIIAVCEAPEQTENARLIACAPAAVAALLGMFEAFGGEDILKTFRGGPKHDACKAAKDVMSSVEPLALKVGAL